MADQFDSAPIIGALGSVGTFHAKAAGWAIPSDHAHATLAFSVFA